MSMILERRASGLFRLVSWFVWKIPGKGALKMAEFSHTEAGSGLDMLAATEETTSEELRRKFFQHALDEQKHARLFAERAKALTSARSRARAVLDDANYIRSHGIRPVESLYESMGDLRFMAFVWLSELRGAQQFDVYSELMAGDEASVKMFQEIARDERFHIAYSRRELDRFAQAGHAVRWAVFMTRLKRLNEGAMRLARNFGEMMASLWLIAIYFVFLGPFAFLARRGERLRGFVAAEPITSDRRAFALEQI